MLVRNNVLGILKRIYLYQDIGNKDYTDDAGVHIVTPKSILLVVQIC